MSLSAHSTRPARRPQVLAQRKNLKIARSAKDYVRANIQQFYTWLDRSKATARIPLGPAIWICGDCHTGNLGPVADKHGRVSIQIRDLDQTVIGNPAHDLLRLGVSFAMAARGSDLSGVTTAQMIEAMVVGYAQALRGVSPKVRAGQSSPVERVLRKSLSRKWRNLANERQEDTRPNIPLGLNFWPLDEKERRELKRLFTKSEDFDFLQCLPGGKKGRSLKMVDAAFWVKGCSSLGKKRYIVLLRVGKTYRLMDIKEAAKAQAPASRTAKMPANAATRVIEGARHTSPYLGDRMVPVKLAGLDFVVRELRPQDVKFDLTEIKPSEGIFIAKLFAAVVGKAHGRQMTRQEKVVWARQLHMGWSKDLNAPGWLWNSIVDLVGMHERSYLEYCRTYARAG